MGINYNLFADRSSAAATSRFESLRFILSEASMNFGYDDLFLLDPNIVGTPRPHQVKRLDRADRILANKILFSAGYSLLSTAQSLEVFSRPAAERTGLEDDPEKTASVKEKEAKIDRKADLVALAVHTLTQDTVGAPEKVLDKLVERFCAPKKGAKAKTEDEELEALGHDAENARMMGGTIEEWTARRHRNEGFVSISDVETKEYISKTLQERGVNLTTYMYRAVNGTQYDGDIPEDEFSDLLDMLSAECVRQIEGIKDVTSLYKKTKETQYVGSRQQKRIKRHDAASVALWEDLDALIGRIGDHFEDEVVDQYEREGYEIHEEVDSAGRRQYEIESH